MWSDRLHSTAQHVYRASQIGTQRTGIVVQKNPSFCRTQSSWNHNFQQCFTTATDSKKLAWIKVATIEAQHYSAHQILYFRQFGVEKLEVVLLLMSTEGAKRRINRCVTPHWRLNITRHIDFDNFVCLALRSWCLRLCWNREVNAGNLVVVIAVICGSWRRKRVVPLRLWFPTSAHLAWWGLEKKLGSQDWQKWYISTSFSLCQYEPRTLS